MKMRKEKLPLYLLSLLLFFSIISTAKGDCIVQRQILDIEEDDDFWLYDDDDDYGENKPKKESKITYQYSILCEDVVLNPELSLQSQITGNHKDESTQATVITFKNSSLATVSVAFFKGMEAVTKLDMSNCSISSIEPGALKMPNLLSLHLENNNLTVIKNGTLTELSKLVDIYLTSNKINTFESFENCVMLNNIYLGNNNITSVQEEHFKDLNIIVELDLSNNNIATIHPNALKVVDIRYIHLQNNALETFPVFSNSHSLRLLDLSHNHIKDISFDNLTITGYAFNFYFFLRRELNLGYNDLTSVPKNISKVSLLSRVLYLNNNNIKTIAANDFNGMNTTQILSLSNNNIDTIEIGAFREMLRLQQLDLSANKLKEIKPGVFSGLKNVNYLNMSYNEFIHFDATPFFTMSSLNDLGFSGNYLHSLNTSEFHFQNLEYISLDFHHISCPALAKFIKAFKTHGITVRNGSTYLSENVDGIACNHSVVPTTSTTTTTIKPTTTKLTTVSSTSSAVVTETTTVTKNVTPVPVTSIVTEPNVSGKSDLKQSDTSKTSHTVLIVTIVLLIVSATGLAVWFGKKYYYKRISNNNENDAQYRLVNILEDTERF